MLYESPHKTLAQILMSRHVGLRHIRLAGEVVVAEARLNEWLIEAGDAIPPDVHWELVERYIAIEDQYKDAWEALMSQPTDKAKRWLKLKDLEIALADAAARFRLMHEELVERFGDSVADSWLADSVRWRTTHGVRWGAPLAGETPVLVHNCGGIEHLARMAGGPAFLGISIRTRGGWVHYGS